MHDRMTAGDAVDYTIKVLPPLTYGCAMGSATAAMHHGKDKQYAYNDVDVFLFSDAELVRTTEYLLGQGLEFVDERDRRVWRRWMKWMTLNFKTNTIHLVDPAVGVELNLTYKFYEGKPVRTIGQVAESFDFSHCIIGYDLASQRWFDFRQTYFPPEDYDWLKSWLMLERELRWMEGAIVPYTAIRQAGRYYKHGAPMRYGYDLSNIKPLLVQGFEIAGEYHVSNSYSEEKQTLGQIYLRLGKAVDEDDWATLAEADTALPIHRDLDEFLKVID